MSILTIVKPENLKQFKQHLKHLQYFHITYERTNSNEKLLHITGHIERIINDIKTEYIILYTIPGSISINKLPYNQQNNTSIYLTSYSGGEYQFKNIFINYKPTDYLSIEIYLDNESDITKELNIINETIIFKLTRSDNKSTLYSSYDSTLINYQLINNPRYLYNNSYTSSMITQNNTTMIEYIHKLQTNTTIIY